MANQDQEFEGNLPWIRARLLDFRKLLEVLIALAFDAVLILAVWYLRQFVLWAIGVDPSTIQDKTMFWVVRLSELSTIIILAMYIISDVLSHLLKAYQEIKRHYIEIFYPKT